MVITLNGLSSRRIQKADIIDVKKGNTQHYLDLGATLALFKEIQALGWLNFVIGADRL